MKMAHQIKKSEFLAFDLQAMGRNSSNSEVSGSWQKQPSGNHAWNTKQGTPGFNQSLFHVPIIFTHSFRLRNSELLSNY